MNNDKNDSIPSIEDAMKEYETVNNNPALNNQEVNNNNNSAVNNVQEEVINNNIIENVSEQVSHVQPQAKYHVNGKDYNSLIEMMEEQDREKLLKEQLEKEKNIQANPSNPINNNQNDYLRYYIGNNYEKYVKGGISFAYFFFGESYLIYRKMYVPAIIKNLITIFLVLLALSFYRGGNNQGATFCYIGLLLVQLLPIFVVKSFYLNYANEKVKKILEENKDKSEQELMNICSQKGGTSIIAVFSLMLVFLAINTLSRFIPFLSVSSNELDTYEIKIRDLRTLSTNYLGMVKSELNSQSVIIENECIVKINTKSWEDGTEIDNLVLGLEKNINNHIWFRSGEEEINQIYATNGDYIYTIEYYDYQTNENCKKSIDILLDNLKFD